MAPTEEAQQASPSAGSASFEPLPASTADLAGSTNHQEKNFSVDVSNANGYMCHTTVKAQWELSPADIFALFTYPDNARLFRDLKHVGGRKVLSEEGARRVVQVEQLGEMRVLWMTRKYSTWLTVTEDWSDPECTRTAFELLSSDILTKFNGSWEFTPVEKGGKAGCAGVLQHDVLPKGVPTFLQHVPVLGGLLRGISMRAVRRLMEDTNAAVAKIKAGHAKGRTTLEVLRGLCGEFDAANPPPPTAPPIQSYALDLSDAGGGCDASSDGHSEQLHHQEHVGGEVAGHVSTTGAATKHAEQDVKENGVASAASMAATPDLHAPVIAASAVNKEGGHAAGAATYAAAVGKEAEEAEESAVAGAAGAAGREESA